jgi:hypothetical protein
MLDERTMLRKNSAMRRTLVEICIVSRFLNNLVKMVYNIKQEFFFIQRLVIGSRVTKVKIKSRITTLISHNLFPYIKKLLKRD